MRSMRAAGFTLLELMIAVAIIGILAAIAIPNYQSYLVKANRSAAQQHMLALASKQEQYLLDSRAYASTEAALGYSSTPSDVSGKYTIAIATTATPLGFTITATPVAGGSQAADGTLTLDNTGAKTPVGKW